MKARRRARAAAFQTLFEVDVAAHDPSPVLHRRIEDCSVARDGADFALHLVEGVLNHLSQVDPIIREIAPEWPLEQMSPIDKNILRIAVFEMTFDPDIPVKVAINEAVELAKLFGSESSRRFVNGALGALATRQTPKQIQEQGK